MTSTVNVANLSGVNGGRYVSSGQTVNGDFIGFLALTDTVMDSDTVCNVEDLDFSGETIMAGLYVPGAFLSIKLTSGSGIAYKRQ